MEEERREQLHIEEERREEQLRIEEERRREEQLRIEEEKRRLEEQQHIEEEERMKALEAQLSSTTLSDASSQTDDCAHLTQSIMKENELLKRRLQDDRFGIKTIEANDEKTKFYTGLPSWSVFLHLFLFLAPPPSPFTL